MIDLIRVIRTGERLRVLVGDVEIPAGALPVGRPDAVVVAVDADEVPTVRLELVARRVDVDNALKEN